MQPDNEELYAIEAEAKERVIRIGCIDVTPINRAFFLRRQQRKFSPEFVLKIEFVIRRVNRGGKNSPKTHIARLG